MGETIGARIRAWRTAQGLSEREFGELLGLSGRNVSNWECGRSEPCVEARRLLRTILDDEDEPAPTLPPVQSYRFDRVTTVECPMCHGGGCGRCTDGRVPASVAIGLIGDIYAPGNDMTKGYRGRALRAARAELELSQQAVADAVGLPRHRLGLLERGHGTLRDEDAELLSAYYGIDLEPEI